MAPVARPVVSPRHCVEDRDQLIVRDGRPLVVYPDEDLLGGTNRGDADGRRSRSMVHRIPDQIRYRLGEAVAVPASTKVSGGLDLHRNAWMGGGYLCDDV